MDSKTYQQWWQLHLQTARGNKLSPAEQQVYDAGLIELDGEEKQTIQMAGLSKLRWLQVQVARLQVDHAQLQTKSVALDKQIVALESTYQLLTGYDLASQLQYATS